MNVSRARHTSTRRLAASIALSAVASIGALSTLPSAAGAAPDKAPPTSAVGHDRSGQRAIDELGPKLDEAARKAGMSRAALEKELKDDPGYHLDGDLNSFFVEETPVAATAGTAGDNWPTTPVYTTDRTFALHSKPGATKKIYLDFNGHTTSGTWWNSGRGDIVSKPFDTNGSPTTWSAAEHAAIQNVYLSVREDYAAFDVDVTTQDPGVEALRKTAAADTSYGTRIVISPTNFYSSTAGGVAYLSTFDGASDIPGFVFTDGSNRPKFIAEAVSHEAGHTLGLHHDGLTGGTNYYQGQGTWAPIMGVGYDKTVTQWSRGQYTGANNLEDDLAVITSHGLSYSADDVAGNTSTLATLPAGTVRYASIGRTGDVDTYRFSLGGTRTIKIDGRNNNAGIDANLNIRMILKDANGVVKSTASPVGTQGATMTITIPAGVYYLSLDGVGEGSPATTGFSNYSSTGYYGLVLNWA